MEKGSFSLRESVFCVAPFAYRGTIVPKGLIGQVVASQPEARTSDVLLPVPLPATRSDENDASYEVEVTSLVGVPAEKFSRL